MPEHKATYRVSCTECEGTGLVERTARGAKTCPQCRGNGTVEAERERVCPLRMLALEVRGSILTGDCVTGRQKILCLKDKCAWWDSGQVSCAVEGISYGISHR